VAPIGGDVLERAKGCDDLVVTVEAEDKFNFRDDLARITTPTLVIAGDEDPFYTPALFLETAEVIPNARLILYPGWAIPPLEAVWPGSLAFPEGGDAGRRLTKQSIKRYMRYNHIGVPTTDNFDGEIDLPELKITVSDHENNPLASSGCDTGTMRLSRGRQEDCPRRIRG